MNLNPAFEPQMDTDGRGLVSYTPVSIKNNKNSHQQSDAKTACFGLFYRARLLTIFNGIPLLSRSSSMKSQ